MVTLGAEAAQPRMVQLMFCSLEESGSKGGIGATGPPQMGAVVAVVLRFLRGRTLWGARLKAALRV